MEVRPLALADVLCLAPSVAGDARGYFLETYRADRYHGVGIAGPFVQDNLSFSRKGVLRGLHLQYPHEQGKLLQVLEGEVFDVAVDVRVGSPTFGRWVGEYLSSTNRWQLWVPPGFAHGFAVTSSEALVSYKCTAYYCPETERCIRWDDAALGIAWPVRDPVLSTKDREGRLLGTIPAAELPKYEGGLPAR